MTLSCFRHWKRTLEDSLPRFHEHGVTPFSYILAYIESFTLVDGVCCHCNDLIVILRSYYGTSVTYDQNPTLPLQQHHFSNE